MAEKDSLKKDLRLDTKVCLRNYLVAQGRKIKFVGCGCFYEKDK